MRGETSSRNYKKSSCLQQKHDHSGLFHATSETKHSCLLTAGVNVIISKEEAFHVSHHHTEKNFPLHIEEDDPSKLGDVLFSFGVKMVMALLQTDGIIWGFQAVPIRLHRCLSTMGQLLYKLWGTSFDPRDDVDLTFSTTSLTSDQFR